jgi:hypothetical protein
VTAKDTLLQVPPHRGKSWSSMNWSKQLHAVTLCCDNGESLQPVGNLGGIWYLPSEHRGRAGVRAGQGTMVSVLTLCCGQVGLRLPGMSSMLESPTTHSVSPSPPLPFRRPQAHSGAVS